MTYPPTPAEFLAQTDVDDEDLDSGPIAPLESIADSLRRIVARVEQHDTDEREEDHQRELTDQLDRELAETHTRLLEKQALIAKVLEVCKPSVSKLANQIREVLEPPVAPAAAEEEPSPDPDPQTAGLIQPHPNAAVEEWRAFGAASGIDTVEAYRMNRSQIRSALGIAQPVTSD